MPKFDRILFSDDQFQNLQIVKNATNLGGIYRWGHDVTAETITSDIVLLAYPTGGRKYEVQPSGDLCGGCFYEPAASPDDVSPYQGLIAGFGASDFYAHIGENGTLS